MKDFHIYAFGKKVKNKLKKIKKLTKSY